MKQIEVQIMGHGYVLGVPEGGEARLQAAVRKVDAAMCRIRDSGKLKARDRIAVLAALNLAFDLAATRDGGAAAAVAAIDSSPAPQPTTTPAPDPRLASLLQRLDTALGGDAR